MKLESALLSLDDATRARSAIVLAADTTVFVEDEILGKPADDDDARRMIRALSGRPHVVATAFVLGDPPAHRAAVLVEKTVETEVVFRALSQPEIEAYVATGEGRDKAGAYALQGRAGALVLRIAGSHTNVIGLPTAEVVMELRKL